MLGSPFHLPLSHPLPEETPGDVEHIVMSFLVRRNTAMSLRTPNDETSAEAVS